ncbi:MAG: tetratricopeptide repeat protein, partial [Thermomicrobiales bacterium]
MQNSVDAAPGRGESLPQPFPEPNATPREAAGLPPTLRLRFAAWLRVSGRLDEAARLLDEIARQWGESAALLDEQAALALAAGDAKAVRTRWQHRLANHPAPSARASFARALLELGDIDDAASIAEELLANHGDLATVRALAADVALLQGDLATAHEHWAPHPAEDATRIAPQLALARIALLGGDLDEARTVLGRVVADPTSLTAAQLASAASLADLLGQPARAQSLRIRCARIEVARAAALAAEIDDALG